MNRKADFMEMQPRRLLRATPPPLTLPPSQPVPPTLLPSPTGTRTPPTSPAEPRTPSPSPATPRAPPPSPASPLAPPPSPRGAPTPPPSPQASLTLAPPPKAQEHKKFLPWAPMLGIPLTLALPSHKQEKLQQFWEKQRQDIGRMMNFNSHELPRVHIRRMMKSDNSLSTGNSSYNEKYGTSNANRGSSSVITDGISVVYGMGSSLPNPSIWQRIPGMMMGPNSAGIGTSFGNFGIDAGRNGWMGMRYNYMPVVVPMSLFPLMEQEEASSSQSSGMFVPVYAPYGFLPYQPNYQMENGYNLIN